MAWFAFLCALFALPMTQEQFTIYRSTPATQATEQAAAPRRG